MKRPAYAFRHRLATHIAAACFVALLSAIAAPVATAEPTTPTCDRFASPAGSDGGSGTRDSPVRSVRALRDTLSAGQTGCLRQGSYGSSSSWTELDRSGVSGAPITLMSFPGERATVQGGLSITGSYVTLSHLTLEQNYLRPRVSHPYCDPQGALALDIYGSHVTLEYNDIHEQSVAAAKRDTAIGVWASPSGARTTNVVIRFNKIHDYGACSAYDHGIYFDHSADGEIYGNWIYNPPCSYGQGGGDHSRGCGAGIQLYVDPQNTKVHGNVIDGTGLGFYLSGAGNDVYNNIVLNTRGYYQTSATLSAPVVFSGWGGTNNQFHDNGLQNAGALCVDCSGIVNLANNQTGDPQFVDAANHNYALKATTPVPASWGIWNGTG